MKELLAQSGHVIWILSDPNWTRTQNHLVYKPRLNHLAKLSKWLRCPLCTYLYGAFECVFLSYHVQISGWIPTLWFSECQGTPCLRQARSLNFKWRQLVSNQQLLSLKTNTQRFSQIGQLIELCCGYLSVQSVWMCVFIMSRTNLRVNPHFIVALMSKNSLLEAHVKSEFQVTAAGREPTTT